MEDNQKVFAFGGAAVAALLVGAGIYLKGGPSEKVEQPVEVTPATEQIDSCILAIDQGTTSSRVLIVNKDLRVVGSASREHAQITPQAGWVEHDADEIYRNVVACLKEVCQKYNLSADNVKAIGITNQRETTVAFDRITGKPFANAIVWHDVRTAGIVKQMTEKAGGNVDKHRKVCGLPINTYFSAQKMRWLLENVKDLEKQPNLCLATIDTYLLRRLTNSTDCIFTDSTNASRTMLMDIEKMEWSDAMLKEYGIKEEWLPKLIKKSSDDFGKVGDAQIPELNGVQISSVIGDQQSACLGHVLREGQIKNTYGTGCFLMQNTGSKPTQSTHGLLTTMCYNVDGKPQYALEGAVEAAGAGVSWAKQIGFISGPKDLEPLARQVEDCGDVYFVPAFGGIFSPYWRDDARGTWIGFTQHSTRSHLARSILEAPCLRTVEVVEAMAKDSGKRVSTMNVDGGMTANNLMMQMQADFLNAKIELKKESEITGIGAAIAAGLYVKYWDSLDSIEKTMATDKVYSPTWNDEQRAKKMKRWSQAVQHSLGFGSADSQA